MAEGGRRRGVGEVVCGNVDRLHRGDGALTGRGDALLERTHLGREVRLVAHGARHAAEERGHLGTGLGEAEDVVDEEQRFLTRRIAELFRHGQRGERDAQTRARRLVHLAEDHRHLVEDVHLLAARVGVLGLLHFQPEVVALAGALADAGEHRVATEVTGDAGDHLLDDDGLADACTAEETDLSTADERAEEVDDLDAGLQDLGLGVELDEVGRLAVDRRGLGRGDRTTLVDRLAEEVEHAAEHAFTHGNAHGRAGVDARVATLHAVGRGEGDAADLAAAEVLGDLADEGHLRTRLFGSLGLEVHMHGVVDLGQVRLGELRVEGRSDDLNDGASAGHVGSN